MLAPEILKSGKKKDTGAIVWGCGSGAIVYEKFSVCAVCVVLFLSTNEPVDWFGQNSQLLCIVVSDRHNHL